MITLPIGASTYPASINCKDFEKIPATNLLALRACLVAKVYFSISLLWQQRWRYRHWQDRNRSRVWLSFINNRSRLPFAMVVHGAAYLSSRKSTIGLSTRLTNKQRWRFDSKYIKSYLQVKETKLWPRALLLQLNNIWIGNENK